MPVTTRRRSRAAVATIAGAAAALATAGIVAATRPHVAEPSAEVIAAQDLLATPTVAGPLPGSTQLSATRYLHPGACADVRAAYLAPGAPVPPQSTLTEQGAAIVITQPWATSGLLLIDSTEGCRYEILASGTLTIDGAVPGLPSGEHFARVLCLEPEDPEDEFSFFAEVHAGGPPLLIVVTEGRVGVVPGTFADAAVLEEEPPTLDVQVALQGTLADGFTGTITGADGTTAAVTGTCTGSPLELMAI